MNKIMLSALNKFNTKNHTKFPLKDFIIESKISTNHVRITVGVPNNYFNTIQFITLKSQLKSLIGYPLGNKSLKIKLREYGLPGKDIKISIITKKGYHISNEVLHNITEKLYFKLKSTPGIKDLSDLKENEDSKIIFTLNKYAKEVGLNEHKVNIQLAAALSGIKVNTTYKNNEEKTIWLQMSNKQKLNKKLISNIPIISPSGHLLSFGAIANLQNTHGRRIIRHEDGIRVSKLSFNIERAISSPREVIAYLVKDVFPKFTAAYPLRLKIEGKSTESYQFFKDLRIKYILVLCLIFAILTWSFKRYDFPCIILLTIPLSITGTILGHYLMHESMNPLTLFGFFVLSGIVVNDSILLIQTYSKEKEQTGADCQTALINATVRRLRSILLTSITTILGMMPFLFIKNVDSAFLRPMAVTISYGLGFVTILLLFFCSRSDLMLF